MLKLKELVVGDLFVITDPEADGLISDKEIFVVTFMEKDGDGNPVCQVLSLETKEVDTADLDLEVERRYFSLT